MLKNKNSYHWDANQYAQHSGKYQQIHSQRGKLIYLTTANQKPNKGINPQAIELQGIETGT